MPPVTPRTFPNIPTTSTAGISQLSQTISVAQRATIIPSQNRSKDFKTAFLPKRKIAPQPGYDLKKQRECFIEASHKNFDPSKTLLNNKGKEETNLLPPQGNKSEASPSSKFLSSQDKNNMEIISILAQAMSKDDLNDEELSIFQKCIDIFEKNEFHKIWQTGPP
ncbi:hypothetical protein HHI36_014899 [Cryptolaemus montrouzieri]|uniref:Uncharacterized protein n=1 Tax=Cryptolaemus montrouzieri TaxID=559131 RepID=A0ABD2N4Y1_9CUCU